jgi:hypothetical protein
MAAGVAARWASASTICFWLLATKAWLTSDILRRLAKSGQPVPRFSVAPVHFVGFQWPCTDLLGKRLGKAAEWNHGRACLLVSGFSRRPFTDVRLFTPPRTGR